MVRYRTIALASALAACRATTPPPPTVVPAPPPARVEAPVTPPPPPAPTYTSIVAGASFACAIRNDRTLWCWGDDTAGTLGDGEPYADRAEPAQVPGLTEVVSAFAAGNLACAVTGAGALWCWGAWCLGPQGTVPTLPSPVRVAGVDDATEVAVTLRHVLALRRDGTVVRWDRDANDYNVAPARTEFAPSDHLAALFTGACVATRAGTVQCDLPESPTMLAEPRITPGSLRALVAVAGHIYAVRDGETVRLPVTRPDEVHVSDPPPDVDLVAGNFYGWAAVRRGRVLALFDEPYIAGRTVQADVPVDEATVIPGITNARAVAAGEDFACALTEGTSVRCWGRNEHGQLAETDVVRRIVPRVEAVFAGARGLRLTGSTACAWLAQGSARCWGVSGRSRDGIAFDEGIASAVFPHPRNALGDAVDVDTQDNLACALGPDASITCVLSNDSAARRGGDALERARAPLPAQGISVAITSREVCVALRDGTVRCRGRASHSAPLAPMTMTPVPGLEHVTRLLRTGDAICALVEGGSPQCWGSDTDWGLITRDGSGIHTTPVPRSDVGVAMSLAAGDNHACAVDRDGVVRCWGRGRAGQLGAGFWSERATPMEVAHLRGAVEVAVGSLHSCARMGDGTVRCWGDNGAGQLGDGRAPRGSAEPVAVADLDHVTNVEAAGDVTCALRDDGSVWCWGGGVDEENSQARMLGDGAIGPHPRPVQVRAE